MRKKTYIFTVAGRLSFPTDMLRYDQCRPLTEADSREMELATKREERRDYKVTLVGPYPPTVGRWNSFLWSVVEERSA